MDLPRTLYTVVIIFILGMLSPMVTRCPLQISQYRAMDLCQGISSCLTVSKKDKFYTPPNWKNLQVTISKLMKIADSS